MTSILDHFNLMASESRSPFRFREHLSGVKEKVKEKAIKHNITLFVHRNLTADGSDEDQSHSRFGFRQQMHRIKDVVKNKTHYQEIKDKIKDKIDEKLNQHENQTYPKGFYDQLFSPETENDVYLQTVVICLWAIALLVIIPTIIFVFLPGKKPAGQSRAPSRTINMIFFHVFLCELCYLIYVLLAMVNVAQEFRLVSFFCDIANYGKPRKMSLENEERKFPFPFRNVCDHSHHAIRPALSLSGTFVSELRQVDHLDANL